MRSKILTAARSLFIEHGYDGLSMREIAAAVGVSKPALYYHFRDKESLFLAILIAFFDEIQAIFDDLPGLTAQGRLSLLARRIMNMPLEQRALIRLLSQESDQLPPEARTAVLEKYKACFLSRIEALFDEGIQSGEFRLISPHVALWALLGMLYPYTFVGITGTHADGVALDQAADQMLQIFFDGVKSQRG